MVAPTSGPFNRTETVKGPATDLGFKPDWLWYSRTWYRQRRPYNLPLSFTYSRGQVLDHTGPGQPYSYRHYSNSRVSILNVNMSPSTLYPNTYNKAYGSFKSKAVPDSASLGISLAQRKQALDMIEKRALQLASFANDLRKGRFLRAARTLGIAKPPPGWRKKGRSFADNFLEVHFGWSPLVGDIGSAVDVLQGGVPPARITASASSTTPWKYNTDTSSDPIYYCSGTDYVTWKIGANVTVSNPNLWLANQLGFVNPASVAWDAVPFSFVVGWFVNVDQFLNSFTDFWGLSITEPYITCFYRRTANEREVQKNWPKTGANTTFNVLNYSYVRQTRTPGSIPGPTLRIKDPWILSPTRGLTAVSLLLQRLK